MSAALEFSLARVGAMTLRYSYLLRSSMPRMVEMMYWPTVHSLYPSPCPSPKRERGRLHNGCERVPSPIGERASVRGNALMFMTYP